jgi:hypothetical protein
MGVQVINIGDAFAGVQAPLLRSSLKSVAASYFKVAHKARMEVRYVPPMRLS